MSRRCQVTLVPLGSRIRYRITGRVFCSIMNKQIANSQTYDKTDLVWRRVFGSTRGVALFVKRGKSVKRVIQLDTLGYDSCDKVI